MTAAIHDSRNPSHHALASRALVRARLWQWDAATADATQVCLALLSRAMSLICIKSIEIQPSVIGYIAKSVALVGNGEKHKAYRTCDIASVRFQPAHVTFLLLIKVCIPCMALGCPSCSYCPGYHRVYGRRARRRDIPCRRPHRYRTVQLNLPRSSGTCTCSTMRRILPLTFLTGVYVPSPWKLAHGESRLRGCNTIVGACTSPNAILWESSTLNGVTGKFAGAILQPVEMTCDL